MFDIDLRPGISFFRRGEADWPERRLAQGDTMAAKSRSFIPPFVLLFIFISTGRTTSSHSDLENAGVCPIKWTAKANLPLPHRNGKAVSSGEKIYFMGGYCPATKEEYESSNYEYDPQKDSWTAKAKIPVGRSNFALASLGHRIFVIGGDPVLPNNDLYLTDENRWEGLAPLSIPRQHIDCGIIGDKVYIVGGKIRDPSAPVTPTVESIPITGLEINNVWPNAIRVLKGD